MDDGNVDVGAAVPSSKLFSKTWGSVIFQSSMPRTKQRVDGARVGIKSTGVGGEVSGGMEEGDGQSGTIAHCRG